MEKVVANILQRGFRHLFESADEIGGLTEFAAVHVTDERILLFYMEYRERSPLFDPALDIESQSVESESDQKKRER